MNKSILADKARYCTMQFVAHMSFESKFYVKIYCEEETNQYPLRQCKEPDMRSNNKSKPNFKDFGEGGCNCTMWFVVEDNS